MLIVGLMSGTSVDAVDAALVEVVERRGQIRVRQVAFTKNSFEPSLRHVVFAAFERGTPSDLSALNFSLGEAFAQAALDVIAEARLHPAQIDLIASHGQTISHTPLAEVPSTLQVGEPSVIAERTGITTVADFRPRDVAAGGQGAPLVSFVDYLLFSDSRRSRAIQNLGGIGNVTLLPANAPLEMVRAFDTGPGNMLIDFAARELTSGQLQCDLDGRLAAAGRVDQALLEEMLAHPFFSRRPPKTAGREEFGDAFGRHVLALADKRSLSPEDILATVTAFAAESVARAYADFAGCSVQEVVLGGGGSYNPTLVEMLRRRLEPARVVRHEDLGFSGDAKEAIAFAVLGYFAIQGKSNTLPSCTGARRATPMGKIVPGDNYVSLLRKAVGGRQ